jgi:hypothetical protein
MMRFLRLILSAVLALGGASRTFAQGDQPMRIRSASDIRYAAPWGNDSNDGLSWATAKQYIMSAYDSIAENHGIIYIAEDTRTAPSCNIWIRGASDPNYNQTGNCWRQYKSVDFIGVVGSNHSAIAIGGNKPRTMVYTSDSSAAGSRKPGIWLSGFGGQMSFHNLAIGFPSMGIVVGCDSTWNCHSPGGVQGVAFDNVSSDINTVAGNGPNVLIGWNTFWCSFSNSGFTGNYAESVRVSSMTRSSNMTNVTLASPLTVTIGEIVNVAEQSDFSFTGFFPVQSVTDLTHFTIYNPGPDATPMHVGKEFVVTDKEMPIVDYGGLGVSFKNIGTSGGGIKYTPSNDDVDFGRRSAWSSTSTYSLNALVVYDNGMMKSTWKSRQNNNTNNTPGVGTSWWSPQFPSGGGTGNIEVTDLMAESDYGVHGDFPAVWIDNPAFATNIITNVSNADMNNSLPGVLVTNSQFLNGASGGNIGSNYENLAAHVIVNNASGDAPVRGSIMGNGVSGPATIVGGPSSVDYYQSQGEYGNVFPGRLFGEVDSAIPTAGFQPAMNQMSPQSAWTISGPGSKLTPNVRDPLGGHRAMEASTTDAGYDEFVVMDKSLSTAIGGWFISGAWIRTPGTNSEGSLNQFPFWALGYPGGPSGSWYSYSRNLQKHKGDGDWQWVWNVQQIAQVANPMVKMSFFITSGLVLEVYSPVFYYFPPNTISANEAIRIADQSRSIDPSVAAGEFGDAIGQIPHLNKASTWIADQTFNPGAFNSGNPPQTRMVASAYKNSTTTPSNIAGLSFSVSANTSYTMACHLYYQASVETGGLALTITGPTSPTSVFYSYDEDGGGSSSQSRIATSFGTKLTGEATAAASPTNRHATVTMGLRNGANTGSVQIQGSATGAGTVMVQPGSFCTMQ